MARAGRKRKIGVQREKNGQVQRVYVNPRQQVAEQPHRVVVPVQFREFQEAESEFGRLMLLKKITPAQHEAGKAYAGLVSQYRRVFDIPAPDPQAMDISRVRGSNRQEMPIHVARAIREKYDRAYIAIGNARGGQKAQKAVAHHAVHDRKIDSSDGLKLLIGGLNELVLHFGIDRNLQISSREK
jgi:hypothetical protein